MTAVRLFLAIFRTTDTEARPVVTRLPTQVLCR